MTSTGNAGQSPAQVITTAARLVTQVDELVAQGTVSLIGDQGGSVLITADVYVSRITPGMDMVNIETEIGTVRIDPDAELRLRLEDPQSVDRTVKAPNLHNANDLYELNDALTAYLDRRFGWQAGDDPRDEALNDLTHGAASLINRLLAEHPPAE